MNRLVTVVIPNYNHSRYLPQRIESVLNQTYQNIEIILLDDCSPDNSRDIIMDYAALDKRIKPVFNEQNSGSTFKQWNKGISLATGDYVWLAESDDAAEPDFLAKLVSKLESDSQVVLAYCNSFDIDENNFVKGTWEDYLLKLDALWKNDFVTDGITLIRRFMSYSNIIPNASSAVIRTSILREVGPADGSYKLGGDWHFWAKIISRGKVAYLSQPLNYFRTHSNNVRSKNHLNGTGFEEHTRLLLAMREYGEPDPEFYRKTIDGMLDFWYHGIFYFQIPFHRHVTVYKNLCALEQGFTTTALKAAAGKFFTNGSGFRILLGDKFLYKLFKKKS